jgi:hypothetical protein
MTSLDPKLVEQVIGLLEKPAEVVLPALEKYATENPKVSPQVNALRNFLAEAYGAVPGNAVAGWREVLDIINTGSGPVDSNLGDTA